MIVCDMGFREGQPILPISAGLFGNTITPAHPADLAVYGRISSGRIARIVIYYGLFFLQDVK